MNYCNISSLFIPLDEFSLNSVQNWCLTIHWPVTVLYIKPLMHCASVRLDYEAFWCVNSSECIKYTCFLLLPIVINARHWCSEANNEVLKYFWRPTVLKLYRNSGTVSCIVCVCVCVCVCTYICTQTCVRCALLTTRKHSVLNFGLYWLALFPILEIPVPISARTPITVTDVSMVFLSPSILLLDSLGIFTTIVPFDAIQHMQLKRIVK
jgi:hypothetical protein